MICLIALTVSAMSNFNLPPPTSKRPTLSLPPPSDLPKPLLAPPRAKPDQGRLSNLSPQKRPRVNYQSNANNLNTRLFYPSKKKSKAANPAGSEANAKEHVSDSSDALDDTLSYAEYLDYALAGAAGVYRLERDLYVVQGWDGRRKSTKVYISER